MPVTDGCCVCAVTTDNGRPPHIITPLMGITSLLSSDDEADTAVPVHYARGCSGVWCADDSGFAAATAAASSSDVVIACLGLNPGTNAPTGGAEGEMMDRTSLGLLGMQEDLLKALVATGTPVIVVLLNVRAHTLSCSRCQNAMAEVSW